jgi:hypothetical protein
MAIHYNGILDRRLRARFHVQVELTGVPTDFQTPAQISVEARVVRIFRGDSILKIGDELTFDISVCRRGDKIPCGPSFMLYEKFVSGRYMEIFLNGFPPAVEAFDGSYMILHAPTRTPRLESGNKRTWFERLKRGSPSQRIEGSRLEGQILTKARFQPFEAYRQALAEAFSYAILFSDGDKHAPHKS